jgi:hypothetical protein
MNKVGKNTKQVFMVLGMTKNGINTVSRALKVLNINLGNALTKGNDIWNQAGFWEDQDIVYDINCKLFAELKFAPSGMQVVDADALSRDKVGDIYNAAHAVLNSRFAKADCFGFKDSNTVKVLPFWRNVFSKMSVQDSYLIVLRNPLAAARSYQKLTGCEIELGLLLWCTHLFQAVEGTFESRRIVVSYDLLMQDARKQLERIQHTFQLDAVDEREAQLYISGFSDHGINRFQAEHDELYNHAAIEVVPLCLKLNECLLKLAKDEIHFDDAQFKNSWHEIKNEFTALVPFYDYLDRLLKKRNALNQQLKETKKSVLWKLMSPLLAAEQVSKT